MGWTWTYVVTLMILGLIAYGIYFAMREDAEEERAEYESNPQRVERKI